MDNFEIEIDNDIDREEMKAVLEAVLFTMGGSVELKLLAKSIEQDEKLTKKLVEELADEYNNRKCGMKIIQLEDAYQMCTRAEYYENLIKVASQPKKHVLTDVVLETLSIIAYRQPVTKIEIEKIRGVKSDHAVNKLVEYNLVEERGRLNAPGRPILFGTTEEFLRSFGISSVDELPALEQEIIDDFKKEAEDEIQLKLDL